MHPTYSTFVFDMIEHSYFLLDHEMITSKKVYLKVDLSSLGWFEKDELL